MRNASLEMLQMLCLCYIYAVAVVPRCTKLVSRVNVTTGKILTT